MKNQNKDRILRYMSDLMDLNERTEFEKDLAGSEELTNDLIEINNAVEETILAEDFPADERYFANLLPRVRQKIEKRNKFLSWKKIFYAIPTAAAVLVFTLMIVNSKPNFESTYNDLANEVVNNFSDSTVSEKYFTELDSSPADDILMRSNDGLNIQIPSELEINSDTYTRLIDNPVTEDYSTLNRLSDKELEIVYEKLNSATSRKVIK